MRKFIMDKYNLIAFAIGLIPTILLYLFPPVQFTTPSGLHSVLERPFSEANGRPFLVKRSPLIVC